uniref:Uncharacterized protein n=1 Tax=Arundo donax TaxID=35708 RepID=A0A0A9AI65_ARUDO
MMSVFVFCLALFYVENKIRAPQ